MESIGKKFSNFASQLSNKLRPDRDTANNRSDRATGDWRNIPPPIVPIIPASREVPIKDIIEEMKAFTERNLFDQAIDLFLRCNDAQRYQLVQPFFERFAKVNGTNSGNLWEFCKIL